MFDRNASCKYASARCTYDSNSQGVSTSSGDTSFGLSISIAPSRWSHALLVLVGPQA